MSKLSNKLEDIRYAISTCGFLAGDGLEISFSEFAGRILWYSSSAQAKVIAGWFEGLEGSLKKERDKTIIRFAGHELVQWEEM